MDLDRRQSHVNDGRVEHDHELGDRHDRQYRVGIDASGRAADRGSWRNRIHSLSLTRRPTRGPIYALWPAAASFCASATPTSSVSRETSVKYKWMTSRAGPTSGDAQSLNRLGVDSRSAQSS